MNDEQPAALSTPATKADPNVEPEAELAQRIQKARAILVARQFEELSCVMAERDIFSAKAEKLQRALLDLSQQALAAAGEIEDRDNEIAALKAEIAELKSDLAASV